MKKITILSALAVLSFCGFSQNVEVHLIEYRPAPGQHINIENTGTPQAAQKMTENTGSIVSLGSFGGYIILGFENACVNHPENPYGIDFSLFGNAFSGSSEPGIVWVMKDENHNNLPDDTWYEIAGSNYFHSGTKKDYAVTYIKTSGRDVLWKDNLGNEGNVMANNFNLQEYYPSLLYFPQYPQDSISLTGTLLALEIDRANTQEIKTVSPAFGYADCRPPKQGIELFLPDNPYSEEIEGAGGDPIDISWAVDSAGNYVDLDSVHFVKIVSASLASAGWLGEISTDVAWVEKVQPQPGNSKNENLLVVFHSPAMLLKGNSLQLESVYFENGRKTEAEIGYSSQDESVLTVDATGKITANLKGYTTIQVTAENEIETLAIKVTEPDSIHFQSDFSSVYPGDSIDLVALVFDNEQNEINVPVKFYASESLAGKVIQVGERCIFVAGEPGEINITGLVEGSQVEKQVKVKVQSPEDKIKIYVSIKTENENLLPLQWINVGLSDLNGVVENRQGDYSITDRPSLFHVLDAGLKHADVNYSFKDDSDSGNLYLYKVEKDEIYIYGWGGKTEPQAFARAWIVRLNSNQHLKDFNKIEVSDGDTVVLYHVYDLNTSWNFSRLMSSVDSAATGEEIELLLETSTCWFFDGEINESAFIPVANVPVYAGNTYYTNENGEVNFIMEPDPPFVLNAGNDAVLLSKKVTTGISQLMVHSFHLFPNPVEKILFVQGNFNPGSVFKIIGSNGNCILEGTISSGLTRIDFSGIPSGIYQLIIVHENRIKTRKVIKR